MAGKTAGSQFGSSAGGNMLTVQNQLGWRERPRGRNSAVPLAGTCWLCRIGTDGGKDRGVAIRQFRRRESRAACNRSDRRIQARVQFGCADGRGASRFAICSAIHLHATAASHAVAGHIGDDGGRKMCPPSTPTGLPRPCKTYARCRWIAEHIAHPLRADCKLTINIHTLSRSGQICNLPVLWPVGIATARIPFHCHIDQAVVALSGSSEI